MEDTSNNATRRRLLLGGLAAFAGFGVFGPRRATSRAAADDGAYFEIMHSEAEWKLLLTPEQYAVLRRQGTERAFSSPLNHEKRAGVFACAGCALALFASSTKFDSGTGWPSFWRPLPKAVDETADSTFGMMRTEVHCRRCGGHLGHVFDDGPKPTGLRYCTNGVALTFQASA